MLRTWISQTRFLLIASVLLVIAGCTALPTQTDDAAATPGGPTPLPAGPESAAAVNMRQLLAQQLDLAVEAVTVVAAEPTEWPDACLGAATPDEVCAEVVTPGYRLTFEARGQTYVLHTDPQGYQWRVAQSPAPIIGDPILQWTGLGEDGSCREAILGAEAIAFGRCGGRLLGAPYVAPDRKTDLAEFAAAFASFEAETPAGEVRFTGSGARQPSPAEQRMLAEFAWLTQIEAQTGQAGVSWGLVLTWRREGGIAGLCDELTVDTSGEAFATGCKGGAVQPLGSMRLDAAQLEKLYAWTDALQPFELETKAPATADAMTTRLLFNGRGEAEPGDAEREALGLFAQEVYTAVAQGADPDAAGSEAPGAGDLCPQATAEIQALLNAPHGYCLAYPREYKVEKPNPNETLLVIGGLLNASDARAHINVTDAAGRTAAEAATALENDFKDMGVERSETVVAGAEAVVLDNVPGQEINRRVLFAHGGKLYELYFAPADRNAGEAYGAMEALYDQLLGSFTFVPVAAADANECLSPAPGQALLTHAGLGFCLLHPERFSVDDSVEGQLVLYVDSLMNASDPKLFVNVEEAAGRTAEAIADAVAAEVGETLPDITLDRSFGWTIGYEPATFLDGVPGQDLSRQIFVVHGEGDAQRLYRLVFVPSDPGQPEVTADMDELFELVLRSWRFLE